MKIEQRVLPFKKEIGQRYEFLIIVAMGVWFYLIVTGHLNSTEANQLGVFVMLSCVISLVLMARRAHHQAQRDWKKLKALHEETAKLPRIHEDAKTWLEDNGCNCTLYAYRLSPEQAKNRFGGNFTDYYVRFNSEEDETLFNITFPELGYLRRS